MNPDGSRSSIDESISNEHFGSANVIRRVTDMTYVEFRDKHLILNQPVVIGPMLIQDWECTKSWRVVDQQTAAVDQEAHVGVGLEDINPYVSRPNSLHIREEYGHLRVPVDEDGWRCEETLSDVLDQWQNQKGANIYVKDWHLALQLERQSPDSPPFYRTPSLFADDWMNHYYLQKTEDDFRFVVSLHHGQRLSLIHFEYMGPPATQTRLHRDVCIGVSSDFWYRE